MKYPEYACKCCGCANGDMFYDWYIHKYNKEPDDGAWEAFEGYQALWNEYTDLKQSHIRLEKELNRRNHANRRKIQG